MDRAPRRPMHLDDALPTKPAHPVPDLESMARRFVAPWRRNLLGGVVLGEGECFGEMNLLDRLPRSATVLALNDTHVLTLQKARLRGPHLIYPAIAIATLRAFSLRLRQPHDRALRRLDEERGGCARQRTSWRRHIAGADGSLGRHARPGPSK